MAWQHHLFSVHDIIHPSDTLMIISFSSPAKETPSLVTEHSNTLSIDFPQEKAGKKDLKQLCHHPLTQQCVKCWANIIEISCLAQRSW